MDIAQLHQLFPRELLQPNLSLRKYSLQLTSITFEIFRHQVMRDLVDLSGQEFIYVELELHFSDGVVVVTTRIVRLSSFPSRSRPSSSLRTRFVRCFPVDSCETVSDPAFLRPGARRWLALNMAVVRAPFSDNFTPRCWLSREHRSYRFLSLSLFRAAVTDAESRISNWHFCVALELSRGSTLIVLHRDDRSLFSSTCIARENTVRSGQTRTKDTSALRNESIATPTNSRSTSRLTADW